MLIGWLLAALPLEAGTGRVIKVLPELMDLKGHTSVSPSLYERDGYQAMLRQHPERRSGVRFFVQWKTKGGVYEPLKVRVEVRGTALGKPPPLFVLEQALENVGGMFSHWTSLTLTGEDYHKLGSVTAWRATLWEGDKMLGQQQSFLW
jgi:hypothetical protein